ncbi:alpha/beta hydrolase [Paenibacillus lautus]
MKQTHKPRNKRWIRPFIWILSILAIIIIAGLAILDSLTYEPLDEAKAVFQSDTRVAVERIQDGYRFEPVEGQMIQPDIIFYPGGLVEPESYAPFAKRMAEKGHRVYVASMPLNLAIFGQNKADSFIAEHPDNRYVIGGHSLGGVFAARYAKEHADVIDGVYFMASYADDGGNLNGLNLSALQITGTQDGVLDRTKWEAAKKNLPDATTYVEIEGGNHGQFGAYGMQKGDHEPAITDAEQLDEVSEAMGHWLQSMDESL